MFFILILLLMSVDTLHVFSFCLSFFDTAGLVVLMSLELLLYSNDVNRIILLCKSLRVFYFAWTRSTLRGMSLDVLSIPTSRL